MISEQEREELFREYRTPDHIQAHCREVGRVAGVIAEELDRHGYDIDVDLVRGAGYVHDVVRLRKNHDVEGAGILADRGYLKEAKLVLHHMKYYPFNEVEDLDEQDVLCLADRTVKEDEYVGIDRRMEYLLSKPDCTPEKRKRILRARDTTRALIKQIEKVTGRDFDEMCRKPE